MDTRLLIDPQTHRKRWKPITCSVRTNRAALHCTKLPLPSNNGVHEMPTAHRLLQRWPMDCTGRQDAFPRDNSCALQN